MPTARPGHRAPHAWLSDGRSTLDLFGHGFAVLRFGTPDIADDELERAATRIGAPLQIIDIDQPEIAELYERRLVMVRPDGHVAWRGDSVPADVQPAAGPGSVPRGCVVVHGDADSSLDSRQLGYIASASGLGVVVRRLRS